MLKPLTQKFAASTVALSITMAGITLQPRNAHAGLGIALAVTGGAPVALVVCGAALFSGGFGAMTYGEFDKNHQGLVESLFFLGSLVFGAGLIILDNNAGAKYVQLSDEQAANLSLSQQELSAYNASLDEINTIAESVASDIAASKVKTPAFARSRWDTYRDSLDADAMSAVQKVSASAIRKMEENNI